MTVHRPFRPQPLHQAISGPLSEKTMRRAIAAGLLEAVRVGPGGRLLRIDPTVHAAYRATLRG